MAPEGFGFNGPPADPGSGESDGNPAGSEHRIGTAGVPASADAQLGEGSEPLDAPAVLTNEVLSSERGAEMPGRIKSEHGPKLSTQSAGDFLTGKTVSRHGKGTIRITTAIVLPRKSK